ncbi:hypothetical protein [Deinococcus rufus]|uniref:Uncharacterized protein n=1 Tax=Deinococcus rufus TaxID=2136097 RepID=A0ABV7Z7V0_9DEIO
MTTTSHPQTAMTTLDGMHVPAPHHGHHWLSDPAQFDTALYTQPGTLLQHLSQLPDDPVVVARRAMAAFITDNQEGVNRSLRDLPIAQGPLFPGVYHLLGTLHPAPTLTASPLEELRPAGRDPLHLEGLCLHASALAHAQMRAGQIEQALQNLYMAQMIARSLGMTNRAQLLTIEYARVEMLAGRATPEIIELELRAGMPDRRREWGQRTLAEMLMTHGDYTAAVQALGTPSQDSAMHAALREFAHALLALPTLGEQRVPDAVYRPYWAMARTVRSLQSGENRSHHAVTGLGEPEAGYALLLEALVLGRGRNTGREGARLLQSRSFPVPDQRALRAVLTMGAIADGYTLTGVGRSKKVAPWTEYGEAITHLRSESGLLEVMRHLCVDRMALLAFAPTSTLRPGYSLASIPLMAGQVLLYKGEEIRLPGRTGRVRVLEALGLPHEDIQRVERQRLRNALTAFGQPVVNLGWLARGCLRLSIAARVLGDMNDAAIWKLGYDKAISMMTPCVRAELVRHSPMP